MRGSGKAHRIHRSLSDSRYASGTGCQQISHIRGQPGGSVNILQELYHTQRGSSWTSRVSDLISFYLKHN